MSSKYIILFLMAAVSAAATNSTTLQDFHVEREALGTIKALVQGSGYQDAVEKFNECADLSAGMISRVSCSPVKFGVLSKPHIKTALGEAFKSVVSLFMAHRACARIKDCGDACFSKEFTTLKKVVLDSFENWNESLRQSEQISSVFSRLQKIQDSVNVGLMRSEDIWYVGALCYTMVHAAPGLWVSMYDDFLQDLMRKSLKLGRIALCQERGRFDLTQREDILTLVECNRIQRHFHSFDGLLQHIDSRCEGGEKVAEEPLCAHDALRLYECAPKEESLWQVFKRMCPNETLVKVYDIQCDTLIGPEQELEMVENADPGVGEQNLRMKKLHLA